MAEDEKDVLDETYGALAGHTPEDGLKIMMGMQSEMAAENVRLRSAAAQPTPTPAPVEKVVPDLAPVDLEVIRGEDTKAAAEELNRHTQEVVGTEVKKQLSIRDEVDFPAKRQQAKVQAAEMIRKAGGDFSKHEKQIDEAMSKEGIDHDTQTNSAMWAQAFTTLEGIQAMSGNDKPTGSPHVERPTPNSPNNRSKAVLTPVEAEVKDNFARVAGTDISDEEFAFFRDKGEGSGEPKMNIDDYEEYLLQQANKQKRRR